MDRRKFLQRGLVPALLMTGSLNGCPSPDRQNCRNLLRGKVSGPNAKMPEALLENNQFASGIINVRDLGALGNGTHDDTRPIQEAIDQVAARAWIGGGTVFLPRGVYSVDSLVLKSNVTLRGAGIRASIVRAKSGSKAPFLLTSDSGPVIEGGIRDITFEGNGNTGQGCWQFIARPSLEAPYHGGIWYTLFENVLIQFFDGHGIEFRGGARDYLLPHQFNSFINVRVMRKANNDNNRCLKMTGQNDQFIFINCEFDGDRKGIGINIELGREKEAGVPVGNNAPIVVKFLVCTSQDSDQAILIDRGESIDIDTCWFENLHHAIHAVNSGAVTIRGCHFANAASDSKGTGYGILNEMSATYIENNTFVGHTDYTVASEQPKAIYIQNTSGGPTRNIVQIIDATDTLDLGLLRTCHVRAHNISVKHLQSDISPGELLILRASEGDLYFETSGNIDLGGIPKLHVRPEGIATFTKDDLTGKFVLLSVTGRRMVE